MEGIGIQEKIWSILTTPCLGWLETKKLSPGGCTVQQAWRSRWLYQEGVFSITFDTPWYSM